MSRQTERALGRKLKGMKDQDVYKVFTTAMLNHGKQVEKIVYEALRVEFGFGDKRLDRLSEAVKKLQNEVAND